MNEFTSRFLKQLRFWTLHCLICAAPSFLIAGLILEYFESAENIAAMLLGVSFFIFAYATLGTFWKTLNDPNHLLSRALKVALKVRFIVSAFSLLLLLSAFSGHPESSFVIIFLPDYWAGMVAFTILNAGHHLLGLGEMIPSSGNFTSTLLWTILEGAILSIALFMLTFFCLLIVSAKQKKKWQKESLQQNPASSPRELTSSE